MKKPAPSFGGSTQPSARPMKPAHHGTGDTEKRYVTIMPPGSRPGISSFAIAPTNRAEDNPAQESEHGIHLRGADCKRARPSGWLRAGS